MSSTGRHIVCFVTDDDAVAGFVARVDARRTGHALSAAGLYGSMATTLISACACGGCFPADSLMMRLSNRNSKRAHHLILCLWGACMIGMVECVTMPWPGSDEMPTVMLGWLAVGAGIGWPLWMAAQRKPRRITPMILTAGVIGAGVASIFTPSLQIAFALPLLAIAAGAAALVHRIPDVPVPGYCLSCGYDLRGLDRPRCPECGRPFDASRLKVPLNDTG